MATHTVNFSKDIYWDTGAGILGVRFTKVDSEGLHSDEATVNSVAQSSGTSSTLSYDLTWNIPISPGDVVTYHYDDTVGVYYDSEGYGDELLPGTTLLTGTGWVDNGDGSYTHSGTVAGEVRLLSGDGLLREGVKYTIKVTKTSGALLNVKLGAAGTQNDVNLFTEGNHEAELIAESISTVDAIRYASSIDGEVISNLSVKQAGTPMKSATIKLINCAGDDVYGGVDAGTRVVDGRIYSDWTLTQEAGVGSTLTEAVDYEGISCPEMFVPAGETAYVSGPMPSTQFSNSSEVLSYRFFYSGEEDPNIEVAIRLGADDLWTAYHDMRAGPQTAGARNSLVENWNIDGRVRNDYRSVGGADWNPAKEFISLRVDCSTSAEGCTVRFKDFRRGRTIKPVVVLTFDDGTNDHKAAADYLDAKGFKGTFFVYSDPIIAEDADFLSLQDCIDMHNAGHDIANHTTDGQPLTGKTPIQQIGAIANNSGWIRDNVGSRAEDYLAYPGGENNAEVRGSAATAAVLQARTVSGFRESYEFGLINGNDYMLHGTQAMWYGDDNTTITTELGRVDSSLPYKAALIYIFHKVDGYDGVSTNISQVAYEGIMDGLKTRHDAGTLTVMSFSEWVNSME